MRRAFGWTGVEVPVVGQGSWQMGHDPDAEVAALRRGLDLGLTHVDTAELYGVAEEVVGRAIVGRRDEVFLASKVLPEHASYEGTLAACERSLKALGTDRLDLYMLHWRGRHPLAETMRALEALVRAGKVRFVGVSNFEVEDLDEAAQALGETRLACNQVYYDLRHRGVERRLLPYCQERGVALVGYSPFGQGASLPSPGSAGGRALARVAEARGATPAQVILAFLTREEGTFTIPKAGRAEHVEENAAALDLRLEPAEVAIIDGAFPAPDRDGPLAML